MRPPGFANKAEAAQLPRRPVEAEHLLSIRGSNANDEKKHDGKKSYY